MDWVDEVRERLKRRNRILFSLETDLLQELHHLVQQQNHRTIALWALELADGTAAELTERYPRESRFATAVKTSRDWAAGEVKMRQAQRAILDCHAVAKEMNVPGDIALCHAIGQACGVVHTTGHAMGYPLYDLTALVRRHGIDTCRKPVEDRVTHYITRLHHWSENHASYPHAWTDFMLRD